MHQRRQYDHAVPDLRQILTVIDTVVNLIFYGILIYTGFDKVAGQISTGKETFSLGWPE